jgi:hypothetical protein
MTKNMELWRIVEQKYLDLYIKKEGSNFSTPPLRTILSTDSFSKLYSK